MCQEIFGLNFIARCVSLSPRGAFLFVPLWTIPFMSELKGMYAILVIRLKQSKSLHLIQQDGGCVNTLPILEYIYALLLETWKIPLKASWCFQTLNFQKTFALRICLWKIKVWDTVSSLIFFPRGRLIPCSQSKGGNSGIRKLIASFRIIVTHVILMYIYNLCVLLMVYMFYFLMYIHLMFFINTLLRSEFNSVTYPFYVVLLVQKHLTLCTCTLYVFGNVDVKLFMLLFCMLLEDDIWIDLLLWHF